MITSPDEIDWGEDETPSEDAETTSASPAKIDTPSVKALPTLQFYQKTYASSCGNNDAKAAKLFKEYENRDKIQRLRQELYAVSKGYASDELCLRILGPVRKVRHQGFDKWAFMLLNTLNSKA